MVHRYYYIYIIESHPTDKRMQVGLKTSAKIFPSDGDLQSTLLSKSNEFKPVIALKDIFQIVSIRMLLVCNV